jgi:hypothetical protein
MRYAARSKGPQHGAGSVARSVPVAGAVLDRRRELAEGVVRGRPRPPGPGWELYDIDADPAETHNLATIEPERLRMMITMWWHEAGRYGVLPIVGGPSRKPSKPEPPKRHEFRAGTAPMFIGPRRTSSTLTTRSAPRRRFRRAAQAA